jgi:hypothetical protein
MKVLVCILLVCNSAVFATEIGEGVSSVRQTPAEFVGVVVSVAPDAITGQWVQVRVAYYIVRVWYASDTTMPDVGARIRVLAIYVGQFPYPDRWVPIYRGIAWDSVFVAPVRQNDNHPGGE